MKKLLSTILIIAMLSTLALTGCGDAKKGNSDKSYLEQVKEKGVLTIATEGGFAPFNFIDTSNNNTPAGADITLAQKIADTLGVKLEVNVMDQAAVISGVAEGKYDLGVSACGYTEERAQVLDFTSLYFIVEDDATVLVTKEENKDKYSDYASMKDAKIGVCNGSMEESVAKGYLEDTVTWQKYDKEADGLIALQEGKIDGYITVKQTISLYIQNNSGCGLAETAITFPAEDGAAVIMKKGLAEDEFYTQVNEICETVQKDGTFEQWLEEATELATSLGLAVE